VLRMVSKPDKLSQVFPRGPQNLKAKRKFHDEHVQSSGV